MNVASLNVVGIHQTASPQSDGEHYLPALGLTDNPFPVTPDETHYFFTPGTEAIYEELRHFIEMRKGFLLLTGEIGLGKTTLLRRLIASFDAEHFNTALILCSFLDQAELFETIVRDFGLPVSGQERRIDHLAALNQFLLAESASGKINVLFIDDAQALDAKALDVVRQLSNLETAQNKLIQVVLCGQPELLDTLNQQSLRQVKSRIALHRQLQPFDSVQTLTYIRHRLSIAGAGHVVSISDDGLERLHKLTDGFPRRIHHLMDRCLYALIADDRKLIDAAVVDRAWADMGGLAASRPVSAPALPKRQMAWPVWVGAASMLIAVAALVMVWQPGRPGLTSAPTQSTALTAAPKRATIAAPANWSAARLAFNGLAALEWPAASSVEELTTQLNTALQPHPWQLVMARGQWSVPCDSRPMLAMHDTQGVTWNLSFIEPQWPTEPLQMGNFSEPVRQLQQYFITQGWLGQAELDGVMGPRTATALARFQQSRGLAHTGQFDPATAYQLSCGMAPDVHAGGGAG